MQAIITLALSLLEKVIPTLGGANAALIAQIIDGLIALVPLIIKEYKDAVPFVQNVIFLLKNNNQVTPDQLAALDILEAQIDAAFETAATNALAEDTVAATTPKA